MNGITDVPEAEYHQLPALSVSGARKLLPPSCPARFKYERDNGQPHKAVFDFGHLAHKLVLGAGAGICLINADSYRTKAAQQQRDEAYEANEIPVLAADYAVAEAMLASVNAHPVARRLFWPGTGRPEQSMFWTDEESGVQLRGRLDWLPNPRPGRLVLPDFKTAASADAESFSKSAANYGYAQQAAMYIDGAKALGLDDDPAFVFAVVEKAPPYLVNVIELDSEAIAIGRGLNRRAIHIFKACTESGIWPGYSSDVELVSLPLWYVRQHEDFVEMSL